MSFLVAFESKPEPGFQTWRGSRFYMSATQAIKAAQKLAADNCNVSAMKTTATGELIEILWSTHAELIGKKSGGSL
jgi:hypothetical protein